MYVTAGKISIDGEGVACGGGLVAGGPRTIHAVAAGAYLER